MSDKTLAQWSEALISAANELATTALGYEEGLPLESSLTLPVEGDMTTSCVALVGEGLNLQVGIATNQADSQAMARALLGLDDEQEDLPEQDLADALGEVANILAGGVKRRMADGAPAIQLGLPIVLRGHIEATGSTRAHVTEMRWGQIGGKLLVIRPAAAEGIS